MGENILKHKATGQVVVLFLSGNLMIAEARGLEITSLTKKICRNYHFNKFSTFKYLLWDNLLAVCWSMILFHLHSMARCYLAVFVFWASTLLCNADGRVQI